MLIRIFPPYTIYFTTTSEKSSEEEEKGGLCCHILSSGYSALLVFGFGLANSSCGPFKCAEYFSGSQNNQDHKMKVRQNVFIQIIRTEVKKTRNIRQHLIFHYLSLFLSVCLPVLLLLFTLTA